MKLRPPFCREEELRDVLEAIQSEECRAVFLTADAGQGASTILRAVATEAQTYVPVISIHGAPSLSTVPYGVLARFLTALSLDDIGVRVNVLRAVMAVLEQRRSQILSDGGEPSPALILIDDANAIDPATAELMMSLVLSGTVNIVASHHHSEPLPDPLLKLWANGMAESIELLPLTQEQGHAFCVAMLGGPVLAGTSWHFWSSAAGNPLLMNLVVMDAMESGLLTRKQGVWVAEQQAHTLSQDLIDRVRQQLRGLTSSAAEALNLVALSEPIDAETVRELLGSDAIEELLARKLVQEPDVEHGQLRLINPIFGEMIRSLVPAAQSRLLHEQLASRIDSEPANPEGLLRRVAWAVESGLDVSDEKLLRAATYACKLYQTPLAMKLAAAVQSPAFAVRAKTVRARANFNLGDYAAAGALLENFVDEAGTVEDLLFGTLLAVEVRSATGFPARVIAEDAAALLAAGERFAGEVPEHAESIRRDTAERSRVLELIALSRSGDYSLMPPLIHEVINSDPRPDDENYLMNQSIAMALDSERLAAQGFPMQAQQRAAEAFAIVHAEDHDVFFLPEMIVFRQLCAALCSGDWDVAGHIMDKFAVDAGRVVLSFGGSTAVAAGMVLIRQGKVAAALALLLPGLDAFKVSDPQQLRGFCTAMAFYSAARLGKEELAEKLRADYSENFCMFLVTAHERAYLAAGEEYLKRDGGGLAQLFRQADAARQEGLALLELNALSLAMELGDRSSLSRLIDVASTVEGPWAASLLAFGKALRDNDGAALAGAGEACADAGMFGMAHTALKLAATKLGEQRSGLLLGRVRDMLQRVEGELGETNPGRDDGSPKQRTTVVKLTKREREISSLAVAGHSDRMIADELQLSIRTVEGHLYRCYAKFGVSGRDELAAVFDT